MKSATLSFLTLLALVPAAPLAAQTAAPTGVRGDLIAQLDEAATKLEQLGEAIPQDKYGWRPGTGVRSVGEVLMHVANGNYYLLGMAGISAPEGAMGSENAVTDRAQVVERMRTSFEHVRNAIRGMSDAELDKPATMFGRQTTNRNVLLTTVSHAHEHLGQLIAYARTNGVTPPWSSGAQ
ncbi:MAG: DinB family protein [Gemmatimonadales bacterium]